MAVGARAKPPRVLSSNPRCLLEQEDFLVLRILNMLEHLVGVEEILMVLLNVKEQETALASVGTVVLELIIHVVDPMRNLQHGA